VIQVSQDGFLTGFYYSYIIASTPGSSGEKQIYIFTGFLLFYLLNCINIFSVLSTSFSQTFCNTILFFTCLRSPCFLVNSGTPPLHVTQIKYAADIIAAQEAICQTCHIANVAEKLSSSALF
jgi:hypothetical protein